MRLDATTLRRWLGHRLLDLPPLPAAGATGLRFHSDRVRPGDAFVAMPGARTHGDRYAADALARGAAYVITDRPRPGAVLVDDAGAALLDLGRAARAARRGPVVGVTGSVGKTTTKALLAAALDALVSPGNLNTPHALATVLVDHWLAEDLERPLVMEMGIDHVGEMARLVDVVRPSDALLTAVAPAHLEGLGDLDTVAREKGQVLAAADGVRLASLGAWRRLPADLRPGVQVYALDADGAPCDAPIAWRGHHGAGGDADRLEVGAGQGPAIATVALPGIGRALAENALAAFAMASTLGIDPQRAAARMAGARLEPGRLTRHRLGDWTVLDDSYNANPVAVAEALAVLVRGPRPHAAVLGSMLELGTESAEHHAAAGRACAERGLDLVWAVGAEARPLADACPGARHLTDAAAAVAAAAALPRRGTLLVKGSRGIGLDVLVAHLLRPETCP